MHFVEVHNSIRLEPFQSWVDASNQFVDKPKQLEMNMESVETGRSRWIPFKWTFDS